MLPQLKPKHVHAVWLLIQYRPHTRDLQCKVPASANCSCGALAGRFSPAHAVLGVRKPDTSQQALCSCKRPAASWLSARGWPVLCCTALMSVNTTSSNCSGTLQLDSKLCRGEASASPAGCAQACHPQLQPTAGQKPSAAADTRCRPAPGLLQACQTLCLLELGATLHCGLLRAACLTAVQP